MKVDRRDIALVIAASVLLVSTVVLGYYVFKEDKTKDSDLKVEDVYFLMEGSNTERSQIEIIVFISNIGDKDVSKLEIRAFTVETGSNLAMDDSSATINDVIQQTTVEGNLIVDVPNNDTYRMELLIFKDEKLEIRGSGTIDLTGVGASYDYRNYPSYDTVDDDAMGIGPTGNGEAASLFGGVCVMLIIVGVVVGVILYFALRTGNKPPKDGEEFFQNGPPPPPRHMRRMEPRLEEFGDRNMEEQLLEREARRQRTSERPKLEKVAPPLKEEKKDPEEDKKSK